MQENLKLLKALGAQTAEDENTCAAPINSISAFSFWWEPPPGNFRTVEDLRRELSVKGCTIGALIWGSPHRHPSSGAYLPQPFGNLNNHSYKTQSFRSMTLNCDGFVATTFSKKYAVDFRFNASIQHATERILICGPAYSRQYTPMISDPNNTSTVTETTKDDIMIAMMVPIIHMEKVKYRKGGKIDIGFTFLEVIRSLPEREVALALGVYDCSLEKEMVLANNETSSSCSSMIRGLFCPSALLRQVTERLARRPSRRADY